MDAKLVLQMMCELNVLPLALQITNIAGNVLVENRQPLHTHKVFECPHIKKNKTLFNSLTYCFSVFLRNNWQELGLMPKFIP